MEVIVYVLIVVGFIVVGGVFAVLKKHPELVARLEALEKKPDPQPVVVNVHPAVPVTLPAPASIAPNGAPPAASSITDILFGGSAQTSAPAAAAPVEPAIDFSASVQEFSVVRGQNPFYTGRVEKKYVGCPATGVKVSTTNPSSGGLKTPYSVTVNGVKRQSDNAVESLVFDVSTPEVTVVVDQQPDSIVDLRVG